MKWMNSQKIISQLINGIIRSIWRGYNEKLIKSITALFSLNMNADSKQKIVVKPTMGKIPKTTPKAIVSDSFSGVIPCLRNPKIGTQSLLF